MASNSCVHRYLCKNERLHQERQFVDEHYIGNIDCGRASTLGTLICR